MSVKRNSPSPETLARLRIVLVATTHPGNIGAAARAMLTMGLDRLVLVAPQHFPAPEATRRATGAERVLAQARVTATLAEALSGCVLAIGLTARPREFAGRALSLCDAAVEAVACAGSGGEVAMVFGSEMSGLSNEELAQCTMAASIPTNPEFASLNVASAVQVAAYELRQAAGLSTTWAAPRFAAATHDEIEGVYAHAARTLAQMRFLDPENPRRLMPRLRRLFGRAGLEREEVNILRGILTRIDQWVDGTGRR